MPPKRYLPRNPDPDDPGPRTCECGEMMVWDPDLDLYVCLVPAEECPAKPLPDDEEPITDGDP